ncbi:MAG: TonB-dependent receptor [Prevotellaceae bacterium]|jgi:outer membrane receptor for ferrienterochelin and colicin|nr:TonB-dependent receptor [Prevotellaceae bacterium]
MIKIKYTFIILTLFALCNTKISAQSRNITGKIFAIDSKGNKNPLGFATIVWEKTNVGVSADENGNFSIKKNNDENSKLIASFVGYVNDTLVIPREAEEVEFVLIEESQSLSGATVVARQKGSYISKLSPIMMEVITQAGLSKLACCNLAESFENTASVSVGYSDAVSGARQIRMLGLAGTYVQMLDENIPTLRGIASTYGLSFTPGQWLESIQVSKGTSSVLNGYEAVTGQINVEHRKPDNSQPLFVNLYADADERTEANITSALKLNEKLSTIIFTHGSIDIKKRDDNNDGFIDSPQRKQVNVGNRWLYSADKVIVHFGYRFLTESREGGQMQTNTPNAYISNIDNKHFNSYLKVGIPFNEGGSRSLGIITSYAYHKQNSFFGKKMYDAQQNSLISNVLWQSAFDKDEKHRYTLGATFSHDNYKETFADSKFANSWIGDRTENVAGVFAQYTFKPTDNFDLLAGIRADNNNLFKETLITPRIHLRYNFAKNSTVRASAGRGFYSPNVISDNIGTLATGRKILIDNDIKIEKAWTMGLSFIQNFKVSENRSGYVSADFFRTTFQNQTIVDVEESDEFIHISNLKGKSYSNSYQIDFSIDAIERFNIFATFRYNQTKVDMSRGLVEKPLVDRFKAILNLSYSTKFEKWRFDFTAQLNGSSRLPFYAAQILEKERSKTYPVFFAQITKKYKRLDVYLGVENIGNYMQKQAIINAENPFDNKFDASVVYAPLMRRKIYAGIRFRIDKAGDF